MATETVTVQLTLDRGTDVKVPRERLEEALRRARGNVDPRGQRLRLQQQWSRSVYVIDQMDVIEWS